VNKFGFAPYIRLKKLANTMDEINQTSFLPDLTCNPVRPGSSLDVSDPNATKKILESLPQRPEVDGPADISYVLGSFNRRILLERVVHSIRNDCKGLNSEIVIVDGGSEDGSIDWICQQEDVIAVVQHNRYMKEGKSRRRMSWGRFMNIGFRAASAPLVAMISDDCFLLPGSTRAALARITAATASGLKVGGCAYYFRNWPQDARYYVQRTLAGNLMVNHGIYTRQALSAVGYANETDYAFYKADTDLSLSIWKAGFVIIDCNEAYCEHFLSPKEAARIGNNAMMDYDRRMMHARWPGLIRSELTKKMGRIELDKDPDDTASRVFGDILT
jgi:GT2 family glycosyltransferase